MLSFYEFYTCLELGLIFGIMAIGVYLTFRVIDFSDLTCDGSFVLGGAIAAVLLQANYPPIMATLIAMLGGSLAGLLTSILHLHFKLSKMLSGILVAFMLYSINLKVMQLPNIALLGLDTLFNGNTLLLLTLITAFCILSFTFILSTDLGLAMRAIGQNQVLARNCGINIAAMTSLTLILSNALIALSGALFSQQQGFADVTQGTGTIIVGLASVMIGEKLLPSKKLFWAITCCVVGSILYRLIMALALHSEWLGLETQDLNLITGCIIVAIMLLPQKKKVLAC